MATITAKDVAALRERTGVGMMDCKRALTEAEGDMEKAIVLLREKGLATQAKKSGRIAAEGLVMAVVDPAKKAGCVLEVNSETDFVAKNEAFVEFVKNVAQTIIDTNPADVDDLKTKTISGGSITVEAELQELFLKIRENLQIRRFERMEGILVPYIHGEGKIAVLVNLESDIAADNADLLAAGKDCALQIAAMNAPYLNKEAVPADVLAEEKRIMMAQMSEDPKMANKPEQVIAKIVEGKIGKYYSENCLVDMEFVKDGDYTVQKYIDKVAKDLGGSIKVTNYVRYERGEGIQKRVDDFAAEVENMAKTSSN